MLWNNQNNNNEKANRFSWKNRFVKDMLSNNMIIKWDLDSEHQLCKNLRVKPKGYSCENSNSGNKYQVLKAVNFNLIS